MLMPYKFVIIFPLLTLQHTPEQNDFTPYQSYTTTNMMQDHDLEAYERFWNNIILENINKCDSNSMVE